ncbi:MAG: 4Fe-4S binding protein [Treponema sp.]|jgi:ferredoxin|nr:4Fe-4S binding protein [Treponema sp.]
MTRRIIKIDAEKCNGCGLCAEACREGALEMRDGKAVLLREDYCDGLGNCLPACPAGAIGFEEREAAAFDAEAAARYGGEGSGQGGTADAAPERAGGPGGLFPGGCPGANARLVPRREDAGPAAENPAAPEGMAPRSQLRQWPIQIKLVPPNASFFDNAKLLVSADCAAYAHGNFHNEFMRNRITLIGCPKLDGLDYSEKLTAILLNNNIKSVTVVRMEVPCCGGLERAVVAALKNSGKMIPWQTVTLSTGGKILE